VVDVLSHTQFKHRKAASQRAAKKLFKSSHIVCAKPARCRCKHNAAVSPSSCKADHAALPFSVCYSIVTSSLFLHRGISIAQQKKTFNNLQPVLVAIACAVLQNYPCSFPMMKYTLPVTTSCDKRRSSVAPYIKSVVPSRAERNSAGRGRVNSSKCQTGRWP
jgi:hypothetical protein